MSSKHKYYLVFINLLCKYVHITFHIDKHLNLQFIIRKVYRTFRSITHETLQIGTLVSYRSGIRKGGVKYVTVRARSAKQGRNVTFATSNICKTLKGIVVTT